MTLNKGDKVKITSIAGDNYDSTAEAQYRIIGQVGYVHEVAADGWLFVTIPTHFYYSKGKGAALKLDEVELLEEVHPLPKEHINS